MKLNRDFTSLLKQNLHYYIQSFVFFIIKHASSWILPIIIAEVINTLIKGGIYDLWNLRWIGLGYLFLLFLNVPFHILHVKALSKANRNIESKLRSWLIRKLQQLTISFHSDYQSGKLHAKFIRDVEAVEMMLTQSAKSLLPAIMTFIYIIALTSYKQILITLFFLLIIPIVAIIRKIFGKSIDKQNRKYRVSMENLSARLSESIEMLPVARAHAVENHEISEMEKFFWNIKMQGISVDTINGKFSSISWVILQFFSLGCLIYSGILASKGLIKIGDIVMYQTFFTMLTGSLGTVLASYPIIAKGVDSIRSISEILNSPDLENNIGKKVFPSIKGLVEFRNVNYLYPGTQNKIPAINSLSFKVEAGKTIAIVGGSGSGKTTLINLVIGFLRPDNGQILIDGHDNIDYDMRSLRKNLAVVSQNPVLFHGSIKDNLTYGLKEVREEEIFNALENANALEFIGKLPDSIHTVIGEHGASLSGGQRQRIVIARAILRNPAILIFDEATSALDAESEALVQQAINKIIQKRTTFIVAHRFSTIKNADIVLFMEEGKIIEQGTIKELMDKNGKFAEMAKLQGID
ncbi:MAG: ABC transporter ATP-binding protein/permease [Spirochaetaceae bacterium]